MTSATTSADRRSRIPPATARRLGLGAAAGGALGLLYWPFYAAAYFATPDGAASDDPWWVRAWSEPFREAVGPMLTFADPQGVYVTYGKALTFVVAGWLCGLVALGAWQAHAMGRLGRAALRLALVTTSLLFAASVFLYWTPFIDVAFVALAVPSLLLTMIAYPLLGWATLRARVAPRAVGWLLALGGFPGIIVLTTLTGSLAGGLTALHAAWLVAGVAIARRAGTGAPAGTRTTTEVS